MTPHPAAAGARAIVHRFGGRIRRVLGAAGLAAASFAAQAQIAPPGTEGLSIIALGGEVVATYLGSSAGYTNQLFLGDTLLFDNKVTAANTSISLGDFAAGTELVFRLHVVSSGYDYLSGPAVRNGDGIAHARALADYLQPGNTLVNFEDLQGGGDLNYGDLGFVLSRTQTALVPEPASWALLLAGGTLLLRRRR